MKVTIPMQVEAEELWSDVFGSGWEYFEWFTAIKYEEGSDWDKPGTVLIKSWSPTDEDKRIITRITLDDVVEAYTTLTNKGWSHCGGSGLDNADACTSDAILQTIIYGELVYG